MLVEAFKQGTSSIAGHGAGLMASRPALKINSEQNLIRRKSRSK